jgi:rhamnose utilization protein RhaD (predicted bifunctional aldolase and dehydrogenase)
MATIRFTPKSGRGALLALSRNLGREDRRLAILAEGNASVRISDKTFMVKASGFNLATLGRQGVCECRSEKLIAMLDEKDPGDEAIHNTLLASRVYSRDKKPSVEAIFHAYLLTLPDVHFVGHTHPIVVNQLLCSRYGKTFAMRRIFPDEVVCCGIESVYVPYADPGLKLAQAMRMAVVAYVKRLSRPPRVILLANHGLITLGATPDAVLAATLMCAKAAEIFLGATSIGGIPRFLTAAETKRIAGRPDEHYRQSVLGL